MKKISTAQIPCYIIIAYDNHHDFLKVLKLSKHDRTFLEFSKLLELANFNLTQQCVEDGHCIFPFQLRVVL